MNVLVNPLPATDLTEADRIFRVAFGTFLGLPNPMEFFGDADYVRTRWAADPWRQRWPGKGLAATRRARLSLGLPGCGHAQAQRPGLQWV